MTKETWIGDIRAGKHDGSEIELKGWVHRSREFKQDTICSPPGLHWNRSMCCEKESLVTIL